MPLITAEDVQGWVDQTKLSVTTLDLKLLPFIEEEVLARIGTVYDTTVWVNETTTPRIVKVIISKLYAAWIYDRAYSENQSDRNMYAQRLIDNANMLIQGILSGVIVVVGTTETPLSASYYPTDASSAQEPTLLDPSLGPARFSLGKSF
jgi:NADH:ubiquinone oxidoreductase subunit 4 (subunit M)